MRLNQNTRKNYGKPQMMPLYGLASDDQTRGFRRIEKRGSMDTGISRVIH